MRKVRFGEALYVRHQVIRKNGVFPAATLVYCRGIGIDSTHPVSNEASDLRPVFW